MSNLTNCKVHLELNWIEDCILSSAENSAKFEITDAKLHVLIVILSTKDSANLTKQLNEGFKRSVYWNCYQTKPAKVLEKGTNIYKLLNASFQGVRKLFVLAYVVAAGVANDEASIKVNKKNFLPRGEIKNYSVLIDGRKFYDQPLNGLIKQYDEVKKVSTGQHDYYKTGRLLDYAYFKDNYKLIAVDLSKQKAFFFFLSGFSFTDRDDSQDSRGREGTIFLFHCTTSTLSQTFRHLFATLRVR